MFKRQFYAVDHKDNGDDASSSDSDLNESSDDDSEHEEDDASSPSDGEGAQPGSEDTDDEDGDGEPPEDESEDEVWAAYRDKNIKVVQSIDSKHFLSKKPVEAATEGVKHGVEDAEEDEVEELVGDGVVLRVGGVLKCRLCVKVVCLSDETMRAHLLSKRHIRSLKLLAAGKLKVQLNSDGEEEEEGETHAERLARIRTIAEGAVVAVKRKANSGRQRQRKRAKQRVGKAERAKLRENLASK